MFCFINNFILDFCYVNRICNGMGSLYCDECLCELFVLFMWIVLSCWLFMWIICLWLCSMDVSLLWLIMVGMFFKIWLLICLSKGEWEKDEDEKCVTEKPCIYFVIFRSKFLNLFQNSAFLSPTSRETLYFKPWLQFDQINYFCHL